MRTRRQIYLSLRKENRQSIRPTPSIKMPMIPPGKSRHLPAGHGTEKSKSVTMPEPYHSTVSKKRKKDEMKNHVMRIPKYVPQKGLSIGGAVKVVEVFVSTGSSSARDRSGRTWPASWLMELQQDLRPRRRRGPLEVVGM